MPKQNPTCQTITQEPNDKNRKEQANRAEKPNSKNHTKQTDAIANNDNAIREGIG
jgi:hypothetical protein